MKRLVTLFAALLLLVSPLLSLAQEVIDPFPIDDSVSTMSTLEMYYGALPPDNDGSGNKKITLPISGLPINDISKRPPGLSLAWAISEATVLTFKIKPNEAPSPHFLFDMLTKADKNCSLPRNLYVSQLKSILRQGSLSVRDYKPLSDCSKQPNMKPYTKSPRLHVALQTIAAFKENQGLNMHDVWINIVRSINKGIPVVGIMKADSKFRTLKNETWSANPNNPALFTHTVLIIGYDEVSQEVEVLNCWGPHWGRNGIGRISYKSLYLFNQLFCVMKPTVFKIEKIAKRNQPVAKPVASTSKPVKPEPKPQPAKLSMQATVSLKYKINETVFENINVRHREGFYEVLPPNQWSSSKKQFCLQASHLTSDSYLYIFNIDSDGSAEVLWPRSKKLNESSESTSALIFDKHTVISYPRPRLIVEGNSSRWQERIYTKQSNTTDYLTVLHSSEELEDDELLGIMNQINSQSTNLPYFTRIQKVLGDKMITNVTFEKDNTQVKYKAQSNQGYIVPIVIKID